MKKTLAVLAVIVCMFGLVACGSQNVSVTDTPLFPAEDLESFGRQSVYDFDLIVRTDQIEMYESNEVAYNGLIGWQSALEEIGTFQEVTDVKTDIGADYAIIDVTAKGELKDAVVEFVLDESGKTTSISTTVQYTMAEQMTKAGLNTLIGMGTVFCVLILICLIISCFKIIPKVQAAFSGKANKAANPEKTVAEQAVDNTIAQIIQKEDDLELVAVITAAIAAAEGAAPGAAGTDGYVVRSIRRRA